MLYHFCLFFKLCSVLGVFNSHHHGPIRLSLELELFPLDFVTVNIISFHVWPFAFILQVT